MYKQLNVKAKQKKWIESWKFRIFVSNFFIIYCSTRHFPKRRLLYLTTSTN